MQNVYLYARAKAYFASGGEDPELPTVSVDNSRFLFETGLVSKKLRGLGGFARVVTGREYYNIQFTQSVTRFQFGFTIDTSGNVPITTVAEQEQELGRR